MKKGQVYEATVERVDFPNKGAAQTGEGTVIVKNSLPGQRIKLSVNKIRNGKAEGRLLEVLEKSPLETGSPCSLFGICGGCTYLSLPYEEQLKIKENQVKRLLNGCLSRQKEPWRWEGIKGSPEIYGYRNKMEFTFGDESKEGPLTLGMHRRGSFYDVVTVGDCRIVDEDYRLILKTVLEYFSGQRVGYYHRLRHEGYLRHLVVRKASGTGEILTALVTTSQAPWGSVCGAGAGEESAGRDMVCEESAERRLIEGFRECLLELERSGRLKGSFAGILHIINDSAADIVQCDRMDILYGKDYFYEELLGLRFRISVFSFFQTNTYGAEILYETVREYVEQAGRDSGRRAGTEAEDRGNGRKGGIVYDLYSGTGTIAQMMAPAAEKVIGVEIVEEAVQAAVRNAAENGLHNCEFIAGDVLKVLDTIEEKPDLIILDPPRDGIHPKALPKIIAYGVEHIIYISCKPTSLVRDLEILLQAGYVVERAVTVDQFPWTANVETVCQLSRKTDSRLSAAAGERTESCCD
ncbi:class I SAM-dependent RNA methyltransferase [Acetatifactor muris]|uniref:23S rRNA (Uracil-C(5))-methyltransferase RlmCD n=1 Tax=Acetatifactor muris TaxID=879566 RepID=A0A2K4ZME9_9FIRM|nr:class I SAM-dependent RNA methyltransferase [Acetatifactor muris]MCR2049831.1 class I SAM-dependent RNA methyltransferase [Acetatifactor muris]SOY31596.1 23S rRNA (uracil-C(5))-methyltransferase RlmCD [Acetatifactor muris]